MFSSEKIMRYAVLAVLALGLTSLASAQALPSGPQVINLNATLAESLTLSLSATSVNFTLAAGSNTNAGSAGVTATTKWVLKPGRTAVVVDAYFASAAAALTDGTNNIPSSAFNIKDNAGAYAPLVNTVAFGGALAGLQLENITINGTNKNSQVVDAMLFNIDLSAGTLPQLPASVYTGQLNIQAQATP